jgi:hypothetical protein
MKRPLRHTARTLELLGLSALVWGCGIDLPPATTPAAALPGPAPRGASVVFARPPSVCDSNEYTIVVDERGRFVGNLAPGTRLAYPVTPGRHAFYAWSNFDLRLGINANFNPAAAEHVEAVEGQTYYVAVILNKSGSYCPPWLPPELKGADTATDPGDVASWLRSTTPVDVDRVAGQAKLDSKPALLRTYMELGQWKLQRLDEENARTDRRDEIRTEKLDDPN